MEDIILSFSYAVVESMGCINRHLNASNSAISGMQTSPINCGVLPVGEVHWELV